MKAIAKHLDELPNLLGKIFSFWNRQGGLQENTLAIDNRGEFAARDMVGGDKIQLLVENHFHCSELPPSSIPKPIHFDPRTCFDKNNIIVNEDPVISTEVSLKIKKGEGLQKRRRFSEALEVYLQLTVDPSVYGKLDPAVLFSINLNIAICYLNLNDLIRAKEYIDHAKTLMHGHKEQLCLVLAWYYYEIDALDEALAWAEKAIELKPDYLKAINIVSMVRHKRGVPLETILTEYYFDQAMPKESVLKDSSALLTLGQLFLAENNLEEAIHYLSLSLDNDADGFLAMALLGTAFLMKAFGGRDRIPDLNLNRDIDLKSLAASVDWFERAFNVAQDCGLEGDLKTFYANASSAYSLLGKHQEAYEKVKKAVDLGLRENGLLIQKGKIEVVLGKMKEARETYRGVEGLSAQIETAEAYLLNEQAEEARQILVGLLNENASLELETKTWCRQLLTLAYIQLRQPKEAIKVLDSLDQEGQSGWESKILRARIYEDFQKKVAEAVELYQEAVTESEMHPRAIVEAVSFYGRTEQYDLIIELLQGLIKGKLPFVAVAKDFIYRNLANAHYYKGNFTRAVKVALNGMEKGVKRGDLQNTLAAAYAASKRYSEANKIFQEIHKESPKDYRTILSVATTYLMMGQVEKSVHYFERAERICPGFLDSVFFINYSKAKLLQGDKTEALRLAERAKEIDKDRPKSPAHVFYAHMAVRCGQIDRSVQYLMEFHSCYPKESWVQTIPALEEKSDGTEEIAPEFLQFMRDHSERLNQAITLYREGPLPLYFLATFLRRQVKEVWQWRNFYEMPIHIGCEHPNAVQRETENLKTVRHLMLDYLALLILNHLGFVELLVQELDTLLIAQSLFDEIQQNIIDKEDPELQKLWSFLRSNPKVRFIVPETPPPGEEAELKLMDVIGESMQDTLMMARERRYVLGCGDGKFKQIAGEFGANIVGIPALLEYLHFTEAISDIEISRAKLDLLEENHFFVSFNTQDMINMAKPSGYIFSQQLASFFKPLLPRDPDGWGFSPDYWSFTKVYSSFISHLIQSQVHTDVLLPWLCKHVQTFQEIYIQDLRAKNFPEQFKNCKKTTSAEGSEVPIESVCYLSLAVLYILIRLRCKNPQGRDLLLSAIPSALTYCDILMKYYNGIVPHANQRAESIQKEMGLKLTED